MSRITIHSAAALAESDVQKIRYLMRMARDRDTALANIFPERFKRRDGNDIYFDAGKRRYVTQIDCGR